MLIATIASSAFLVGCRMGGAPLSTSADYLTNRVSLLPLIVYPERYDGKKVVVDGILGKSDGLWRVYLSRELAHQRLDTNSVALDISAKELQLIPERDDAGQPNTVEKFAGKCVAVDGTFSKQGKIFNIASVIEHSLQANVVEKSKGEVSPAD
ncbi:MAG: hypothetical protein U0105_10255 [Candidatus Obscuribacterales bacterium]